MPPQWSKWWWLRIGQFQSWSSDERRALGVFSLAFLMIFLFGVLAGYIFVAGFHLESYATFALSIGLALYLAISNSRGIASDMFPNIIAKGDAAAAKRVGGVIRLPEESSGLWWLDYRYTYRWSYEEQWIRNAIFGIALPTFVLSAPFLFPHLMTWFGLSERSAILLTMVTTLPLSFFIGRRFSAWMWPDFVKTADDNAAARFNHRTLSPRDEV